MIFYILFLLLISILAAIAHFYSDSRKIAEISIVIILIIIAGFRDTIGADYNSYVYWYLQKARDSDFEFGFLAVMKLFRRLQLTPEFLFFFFSFFTILLFYLGFKKFTTNIAIALLFFVLIPSLFLTSFTLVRQSLAVAIGFYSFHFLLQKRYLAYCLWMLLGIGFHKSLLIPSVLFVLVYKYVNYFNIKVICCILFGAFAIAQLNLINIFSVLFENSRYSYYFKHNLNEVNTYKLILLNLECILILFYFEKLKGKYLQHHYIVVLYCLSIALINLFSKNYDMSRMATYFRVFEVVIIADVIFLEFKLKRLLLLSTFYILYFGAFINGINTDFNRYHGKVPTFIPYKNLLLKNE
ncbi:EpsG family protein [Flavobacterium algicola]|uniref:EpsG family protein n=1 Tax=Flavobacterium algicola TaxID=556529 RepID=UPI001EFC5BBD|nr:EpsG family protein [Flavobacterium algicola]MCG9793921.1 EpsG family protein [Flavobacterium algicola]